MDDFVCYEDLDYETINDEEDNFVIEEDERFKSVLYQIDNNEKEELINALKDRGYYENRLIIYRDRFIDSDSFAVRDYYYSMFCELLEEYKEYLEAMNIFEYLGEFEQARQAMKYNLEEGYSRKLTK